MENYAQTLYFFEKGNILISRRYQLHPASAPTRCHQTSRMHTAKNKIKKRERKKTKTPSRCSGTRNRSTLTTTKYNTRTTNKALRKQHLQEGNKAQALSLPDRRSKVFTLEEVRALKTIPSARQLPGTTNEDQTLGFHPESYDSAPEEHQQK